jgi:Tol biopolymer transport system component
MTAPSEWTGSFDISSDGNRIVFSNHTYRSNITKVSLDADAGKMENAVNLTRGSLPAEYPRVSPDGKWITFRTGGRQEDVYLMNSDGTGLRKLTDDSFRDRAPDWSPDGNNIIFYSDRSGRYEIWQIRIDGSGLEQMTQTEGPAVWYPRWAPDGSRYLTYNNTGTAIVPSGPIPFQMSEAKWLPQWNDTGRFAAKSWSPDGKRIAGEMFGEDYRHLPGVFIYSFETDSYSQYCKQLDHPQSAQFLSDGRRLLVSTESDFILVDTETGDYETVFHTPDTMHFEFCLSPDDTSVYFAAISRESDIWMATIERR